MSPSSPGATRWAVREAAADDVELVVMAVAALLVELGGIPPGAGAMRSATHALVEGEHRGVVLLAESPERRPVGLLAASWQCAIHAGGIYGLVQDLWVERSWRGAGVGGSLLSALRRGALERGVTRLEVGLPQSAYAQLDATRSFYERSGFEPRGERLRWQLT